jgi:hypothetical protein
VKKIRFNLSIGIISSFENYIHIFLNGIEDIAIKSIDQPIGTPKKEYLLLHNSVPIMLDVHFARSNIMGTEL